MTITQAARQQEVARALEAIGQLFMLPEITLQIIEIVEDPESTAEDLHAVIAKDPALCAHILKVVNSALYGLSTTIGSAERAIVVLGFNSIKSIATAASMSRMFEGDLSDEALAKSLWDHCNAVALAAKLLADHIGAGYGEEAYLAGLLHDIGIIVEMQYNPDGFARALDACAPGAKGIPCECLTVAEEEALGANHQDFGAQLCSSWRFPPALVAAVEYHHNPLAGPEALREFVSVVHAADGLAGMLDDSLRVELRDPLILDSVRTSLGLTDELIASLLDDLRQALAEAQAAA